MYDKYVVRYLSFLSELPFMDLSNQSELQHIFGQNVKNVRLRSSLTQMQLAVKAETDIRQIQRIEAGEISTSITQAYFIARALNVKLDELFNR